MIPLQRAWDQFVIDSWFKNGYAPMRVVVAQFIEQEGCSFEVFKELNRTPAHKGMWYEACRRFVCGHFLKAQDLFWNTKEDDAERRAKLVVWFGKQKMVGPALGDAALKSEVKKTRRDYRRAMMERSAWEDHKGATNRSNWKACK